MALVHCQDGWAGKLTLCPFSVRTGRADAGTAAMILHDDGASGALLGEELLRYLYCDKDGGAEAQAMMGLQALGTLRGRGPMRARLPNTRSSADAAEPQLPAAKAGSGVPAGGVAEHVMPPRSAPALSAGARSHIYAGDVDKGKSTGWHYEPTGSSAAGTYVLEPSRSPPDAHGVYEANVVIKGIKKKARSSFFPAHWTPEEIDKAILDAYAIRQPVVGKPAGWFVATTSSGVQVEMQVLKDGTIGTAYPVRQRGKQP